MHGIIFNVFKEEISGDKGTDWPTVESPHYDPEGGPGECPGDCSSCLSLLCTDAVHASDQSLTESSHICVIL